MMMMIMMNTLLFKSCYRELCCIGPYLDFKTATIATSIVILNLNSVILSITPSKLST